MPTPPLTPLAAAVLDVGVPERILELRCGEGDGVLFLAREFPQARVRGVDTSAEAVRRATARVGLDPEGRVAFKVSERASLPFPDDHFDVLAVVDGAPPPAEAARVLRPGGHLILARTHGANPQPGFAGRLLRWRLARRGIVEQRSAPAGDGSFSVARLREPG